jgi:hypothetical protein
MSDNSRLQSSIVQASVESGKGMASGAKDADKDAGMTELFKLNQVWYRMPPSLSLVNKRTITKCFFQQTGYSPPLVNQVASCVFNSGEFYISGCTSFLVIRAGIDKSSAPNLVPGIFKSTNLPMQRASVRALLGQGGIMNIIEEVTFLSASGTEVDRQQNKGMQAAHVTRNRNSQDWYNSAAELQGHPGGTFKDCYDGLGFSGHAPNDNSTGGAGSTSPWLLPVRNTKASDSSNAYLKLMNSTNSAALTTSAYNLTSYPGGGPTGSVDVSFDSTYDATYNPVVGQAKIFFIPMSELLGCFNPYMKALIPAGMLAGGRIEIRFKSMTEALIATGPGFDYSLPSNASSSATSISNANTFLNEFRIYDAYFLLDSFQMNETVLRRLNEVSAGEEGLSMMFDTWDHTQTPVSGLSFEAQVSQARSRITRSFCVLRDQLIRVAPFANSLASEASINRPNANSLAYSLVPDTTPSTGMHQQCVNSYQGILGSLYFPQQPLVNQEEFVMNSYYTFSRAWCNPEEVSAVSLSEFMGATGRNVFIGTGAAAVAVAPLQLQDSDAPVTPTDVQRVYSTVTPAWSINWGSATYGFLAERSQLLQLAGLPISNARLLRHRFSVNYTEASGTGRIVDVFTEYTRVMKVYVGGRIVMRE